MTQSIGSAAYCINPDCPRPYPQAWDNKYCNSCGATLRLNQRYTALQRLGVGGFAVIYTVWDLQTRTEKVLKVLVETNPKALELFEQEAAVLASLRHPGIPRVEADSYFQLDLGVADGKRLPCLVMEKITGKTLQDILDRDYPLGCPENLVRNWLKQAVDILSELHRRRIIHRDIKPSNLMLRQSSGQLVAIDFGGAKQITPVKIGAQTSSTRLVSPGYSPPEQIAGIGVGAPADFYALGKTMIHLLTGKYPPDIEDPHTGELRWRNYTSVSPGLADLLDRMVQVDPQKRPASALEIQQRLAEIALKTTSKSVSAPSQVFTQVAETGINVGLDILGKIASASLIVSKAAINLALFCFNVIISIVRAGFDTIWEMLVGGIGAAVAATTGFWLTYWSKLGTSLAAILTQEIGRLFPGTQAQIQPEIVLFTLAGLGTAWGLTEAGGFGQRKRRFVGGLTGILGYGLAALFWQAIVSRQNIDGLILIIAIAVSVLTLGLGLRSHHLVYALITGTGTAVVLAGLIVTNLLPAITLMNLFSVNNASGEQLLISVAFFSLLAIATAFWLGVSYYIIVPFLRFLGWR